VVQASSFSKFSERKEKQRWKFDHTGYDEDPQFHPASIRKTHDEAINLFQKSKDRSILAYGTPVVDVHVYPSK